MVEHKMKTKKPAQQRSAKTYELILDTAANLLEEIGFDKLNTNLICERAGLTPPALYRYFPNKYAVLTLLGERMMAVQNAALENWLLGLTSADNTADQIKAMLLEQYQVTVAQKGGASIMRSLRSTPQLADIRLNSHDKMTIRIVERQAALDPAIDLETAGRRNRLTMEMGYAAIELLIDLPATDADQTMTDVATMISALG